MFNHKIQRNNFAPSPLDYIQGKIEQARHNLHLQGQHKSEPTPPIPLSISPVPEYTSRRIDDQEGDAFNDLSSDADTNDLLSVPDTPLLPSHYKSSFQRDASPVAQTLSIISQPVSLLLLCAALFFVSATATPILARFNLYQATYKFPFPLTICFFPLVFAETALQLCLVLSTLLFRAWPAARQYLPELDAFIWDLSTVKRLFPMSFSFFVGTAALFSCLEYVPMNYAVLFLSPTIVFQMVCTKVYSPDHPQSIQVAGACLLVLLGYILSALSPQLPGMPGANAQGFLTGMLAALALPIHNCLSKQALATNEYTLIQLMHTILISSIGILLPLLVISGEIFEISAHCFFLDEKGFWLMIFLLSVVGALAFFGQFMLLVFTTPLTVVVLYYAKTALIQLPISLSMNKTSMNRFNYLGFVLSLIGLSYYLYLINYHRPRFGLKWKT